MKKMNADEHAQWIAKNWNDRLPADKKDLLALVEYDRSTQQVFIAIQNSDVVRYLHGETSPQPVIVAEHPKLRSTFTAILNACQAEITTMLREIPDFPWDSPSLQA